MPTDKDNDDEALALLEEEPDLLNSSNIPLEIEEDNAQLLDSMVAEMADSVDDDNVELDDDEVMLEEQKDDDGEEGSISTTEKRTRLDQFFKNQVDTGAWSKTHPMPRKGRDVEFDKLLNDLGLITNRRYASSQFRIWKERHNYDNPVIQNDPQKLKAQFQMVLAEYEAARGSKLVDEAKNMPGTDRFRGITNTELERFVVALENHKIRELMERFLNILTEQFASSISGARHYSAGAKSAKHST